VLRACRKLLRGGGGTAFFTIVIAPSLSKADHRVAVRLGPRATRSTRPVDVLMDAAGFVDIEVIDFTDDFLDVARAWEQEFTANEDALRPIFGDEWEERQDDRRSMIGGIERGLLRRILVTGATDGRGE
jgi:cyclopropane fatty-acyl-phospholipid synthase-like methyltransferase